jgi:ubiquitin-protein ligase E3 D
MKILFQDVPDVEALLQPDKGKPASISLEELHLPVAIYTETMDSLKQSHEALPLPARRFLEWNVGLLKRFVRASTN